MLSSAGGWVKAGGQLILWPGIEPIQADAPLATVLPCTLGDVTNLAARLTSSAHNGEIVVDHHTYEAVAPAFPDARHEELTLKGKREAVAAYWIPP